MPLVDFVSIHTVAVACAALVAVLLIFETRQILIGKLIVKPLASLAFIVAFDQAGVLDVDRTWAVMLFVAALACFAGDIFLIFAASDLMFRCGIVAFALGHVAFASAFADFHFDALMLLLGAIPTGMLLAAVHQYLLPHVHRGKPHMVVPVRGYMLVIFVMVALSFATHSLGFVLSAVIFMISDIFVARARFVSPQGSRGQAMDRVISLPLYYGAQLGFAYSARHMLTYYRRMV